jgi:hypothetical protein
MNDLRVQHGNSIDERGVLTGASDSVGDIDLLGTTFVIPLDAPLPHELSGVVLPTGTLYQRLVHLDHLDEGEEFAFTPVSGGELLALERSWRSLVTVKKVAVLTELPGARYDVIFDQAKRQIGLRSIDWPSVSEALASKLRETQRTGDKTPWLLEEPTKIAASRPKGSSLISGREHVPPPSDDDGDIKEEV